MVHIVAARFCPEKKLKRGGNVTVKVEKISGSPASLTLLFAAVYTFAEGVMATLLSAPWIYTMPEKN